MIEEPSAAQRQMFAEADAAIRPKVKRMLEVNPPDPLDYRDGIVVGYFIDKPAQGSQKRRCCHCKVLMWVGPKSIARMEREPELKHLCIVCTLAVHALAAPYDIEWDVEQP